MTTIRLFGTAVDSIVDGPGLRYAVFVQGCPHGCDGCHNPGSHDAQGGYEVGIADLVRDIDKARSCTGVTISGGEPFMQPEALHELVCSLNAHGHHDIWVYTGYTLEALQAMHDARIDDVLCRISTLVDGQYIKELRSLSIPWRGSTNQRIINLGGD